MSNDYSDVQIESNLPKPWEEEETFNDVLYDWMSKAPWLLISAALHFVIGLIVAAIPWSAFDSAPEQVIEASVEQPPEEIIEEEEEEIEEIEEETEEEPILEDFEVSDHNETDTNSEFESTEGDPNQNADSPFDSKNSNSMLGIGGGAGGKMGGRFGGNKNLRAGGKANAAIKAGLEWLKNHQDEDGKWDCDEFFKHDPAGDQTDGIGDANHDIGVTGLALLAFLGDGHSMTKGSYKDVVTKGVKWLISQQDKETGLFGEKIGHSFVYDHAIATLAMCETYYIDKSTILKRKAQNAINFITQARNPYRVWRYEVPPDGSNDTSVTGWMIFALKSAEDGGLKVDKEAYAAAIEWFDEMTDPGTGRVGYTETGSASSRVPGMNDQYPAEKGEALTAVTLLCRFFLGQNPEDDASYMNKHADLLLKTLPEWDKDGLSNDMYYWYYGSYAMFQMGNKKGGAKENYWEKWRKAMEPAVLGSQRKDGASKGSWDPIGPWGYSGGRVYSTATMVLCLEVYFRYARVLGAR